MSKPAVVDTSIGAYASIALRWLIHARSVAFARHK